MMASTLVEGFRWNEYYEFVGLVSLHELVVLRPLPQP
jgi:hypothetical protein